MIVAGLLCWYDERPEWLATAIAGFARVCDRIVAVDGPYALYPGARNAPRSPQDQTEAVIGACEAANVELTLHQPREPFWGNEVEKRNLSLALASEVDWLIVFDADMRVIHADAEAVRWELDHTDRNVGTYTLQDGHDGDAWKSPFRGIYRWSDDLVYGPAHYDITGTYAGCSESLRDDAPAFDVTLTVAHPIGQRQPTRKANALAYGQSRDIYHAEARV
jgi:hypothetical protein